MASVPSLLAAVCPAGFCRTGRVHSGSVFVIHSIGEACLNLLHDRVATTCPA